MKWPRWHNLLATGLVAACFAGVAAADWPGRTQGRIVIVREPGKPDKHCIVLKSVTQPDGSTMHEVRHLQTGEIIRIADQRTAAHSPLTPPLPLRRLPTTAELAGNPAGSLSAGDTAIQNVGFLRKPKSTPPPAAPSPPLATAQPATSQPPAALQAQMANLKDAESPSQRELAAMALTLGEGHGSPAVVTALMKACRSDPAPSVRATCIRCLFRLAPKAPQVIPIIDERQSDKNVEVQKLAKIALEELSRPPAEKERR